MQWEDMVHMSLEALDWLRERLDGDDARIVARVGALERSGTLPEEAEIGVAVARLHWLLFVVPCAEDPAYRPAVALALQLTQATGAGLDDAVALAQSTVEAARAERRTWPATQRGDFCYDRACQWLEADETMAGIVDLTEALEAVPDDTHALHNRGVAYQRIQSWDRALQDFSRALEIDPDYVGARYKHACLWFDFGHDVDAGRDLVHLRDQLPAEDPMREDVIAMLVELGA